MISEASMLEEKRHNEDLKIERINKISFEEVDDDDYFYNYQFIDNLDNQVFILTGRNGSGKTKFLEFLYELCLKIRLPFMADFKQFDSDSKPLKSNLSQQILIENMKSIEQCLEKQLKEEKIEEIEKLMRTNTHEEKNQYLKNMVEIEVNKYERKSKSEKLIHGKLLASHLTMLKHYKNKEGSFHHKPLEALSEIVKIQKEIKECFGSDEFLETLTKDEKFKDPLEYINKDLKEFSLRLLDKESAIFITKITVNKLEEFERKIEPSSGELFIINLHIIKYIYIEFLQVSVILMDEPDRHLEPKLIEIFFGIITKFTRLENPIQIFMTTHRPDTISLADPDTIWIIDNVEKQIKKCHKYAALFKLTYNLREIMNFKIKVYVESHVDLKFYEIMYKILLNYSNEMRKKNLLNQNRFNSIEFGNNRILSRRYQLEFCSSAKTLTGGQGGKNALLDFLNRELSSINFQINELSLLKEKLSCFKIDEPNLIFSLFDDGFLNENNLGFLKSIKNSIAANLFNQSDQNDRELMIEWFKEKIKEKINEYKYERKLLFLKLDAYYWPPDENDKEESDLQKKIYLISQFSLKINRLNPYLICSLFDNDFLNENNLGFLKSIKNSIAANLLKQSDQNDRELMIKKFKEKIKDKINELKYKQGFLELYKPYGLRDKDDGNLENNFKNEFIKNSDLQNRIHLIKRYSLENYIYDPILICSLFDDYFLNENNLGILISIKNSINKQDDPNFTNLIKHLRDFKVTKENEISEELTENTYIQNLNGENPVKIKYPIILNVSKGHLIGNFFENIFSNGLLKMIEDKICEFTNYFNIKLENKEYTIHKLYQYALSLTENDNQQKLNKTFDQVFRNFICYFLKKKVKIFFEKKSAYFNEDKIFADFKLDDISSLSDFFKNKNDSDKIKPAIFDQTRNFGEFDIEGNNNLKFIFSRLVLKTTLNDFDEITKKFKLEDLVNSFLKDKNNIEKDNNSFPKIFEIWKNENCQTKFDLDDLIKRFLEAEKQDSSNFQKIFGIWRNEKNQKTKDQEFLKNFFVYNEFHSSDGKTLRENIIEKLEENHNNLIYFPLDLAEIFFEINNKVREQIRKVIKH